MIDAGMVMFRTDKPFGTVLGGIMVEMKRKGSVKRYNEIDFSALPESAGDCDLFLDWSCPLRKRYISCRVEEIIGEDEQNEDGDPIHRYAASFKEGNRNTAARVILVCSAAAALLVAGVIGTGAVPKLITILAGIAAGAAILVTGLQPSTKARDYVRSLLNEVKEYK